MLEKAQSYYEHLLGLECDKACADITRCAGLAYDLEAFFNWQSVPFSLDNGDLKKFYTQKAVEAKSLKRAANRKAKREQPAVYHRRGEPPLLSLDSGQHRESDRLPDRLRPRLCRGTDTEVLQGAIARHATGVHQVPLHLGDSGEDWCQPCPAPEPELSQHRCRDVSSGIQEDSQGARQRLGRHREGGLRNQQRCRHRS